MQFLYLSILHVVDAVATLNVILPILAFTLLLHSRSVAIDPVAKYAESSDELKILTVVDPQDDSLLKPDGTLSLQPYQVITGAIQTGLRIPTIVATGGTAEQAVAQPIATKSVKIIDAPPESNIPYIHDFIQAITMQDTPPVAGVSGVIQNTGQPIVYTNGPRESMDALSHDRKSKVFNSVVFANPPQPPRDPNKAAVVGAVLPNQDESPTPRIQLVEANLPASDYMNKAPGSAIMAPPPPPATITFLRSFITVVTSSLLGLGSAHAATLPLGAVAVDTAPQATLTTPGPTAPATTPPVAFVMTNGQQPAVAVNTAATTPPVAPSGFAPAQISAGQGIAVQGLAGQQANTSSVAPAPNANQVPTIYVTPSGKRYFFPNGTPPSTQPTTAPTASPGSIGGVSPYDPSGYQYEAAKAGFLYPTPSFGIGSGNPLANLPMSAIANPIGMGQTIMPSTQLFNGAPMLSVAQQTLLQDEMRYRSLQIESTLLALEKQRLQEQLAIQLRAQLEAQTKAANNADTKVQVIKQAQQVAAAPPPPPPPPPAPPVATKIVDVDGTDDDDKDDDKDDDRGTNSIFPMFNLEDKYDIRRAEADCDGRNEEECKERSEHCRWDKKAKNKKDKKKKKKKKKKKNKKDKKKKKSSGMCKINCANVPVKSCRAIKACHVNKDFECRNRKQHSIRG